FSFCWATLDGDDLQQRMDITNDTTIVQPARRVRGELRLPGDKSISHRYAMLAAIANGTSVLENFSTGADCASTLACMQALSRQVNRKNGNVEIVGNGSELRAPQQPLDCGNSGSTIRM